MLSHSRSQQGHAAPHPNTVGNVPTISRDITQVRRDLRQMNAGQLVTVAMAFTALVAVPRGTSAAPRPRHTHAFGESHDPGRGPQTALTAATLRRMSVEPAAAVVLPAVRVTTSPRVPALEVARDSSGSSLRLTPALREEMKRSLIEDGNPLGDRLAEVLMTRLPGWPADRALSIVIRRWNGSLETIRAYAPSKTGGKPVTLLLEDHVYIALAEQGSPFAEGERMTNPQGDVERGDSLYLAVAKALYPGQRPAIGMPEWDSNDVKAFREKVAIASNAPRNRGKMDVLFGECEKDGCYFDARQRLNAASAAAKPIPAAPLCPRPEREILVGPEQARSSFVFNIHVHDDVTWNTDEIVAGRVNWWLKEMSELLPPDAGLKLRIIRGAKGIADIDYAAREIDERADVVDRFKGLNRFMAAIDRGIPCPRGSGSLPEYHLLLTGKRPYTARKESLLGSALGQYAIASVEDRRTVGHEFGHLLGAEHADGVSRSTGIWRYCVTAMKERGEEFEAAGDCDSFSERNRQRIRQELRAKMVAATIRA